MDVLAHVLWTNVVFYKKYAEERAQRFIAVLFGVLPDLVVFAPSTLYMLFSGREFSPQLFESDLWVFRYAEMGYNFTHSLVIFAVVMTVVTIFRKGRMYWPLWGWVLHIAIDIPTHRDFFLTPFLYPLSGFRFEHGISWAHPVFMVINYGALAAIYLFWFLALRKKDGPVRIN